MLVLLALSSLFLPRICLKYYAFTGPFKFFLLAPSHTYAMGIPFSASCFHDGRWLLVCFWVEPLVVTPICKMFFFLMLAGLPCFGSVMGDSQGHCQVSFWEGSSLPISSGWLLATLSPGTAPVIASRVYTDLPLENTTARWFYNLGYCAFRTGGMGAICCPFHCAMFLDQPLPFFKISHGVLS